MDSESSTSRRSDSDWLLYMLLSVLSLCCDLFKIAVPEMTATSHCQLLKFLFISFPRLFVTYLCVSILRYYALKEVVNAMKLWKAFLHILLIALFVITVVTNFPCISSDCDLFCLHALARRLCVRFYVLHKQQYCSYSQSGRKLQNFLLCLF